MQKDQKVRCAHSIVAAGPGWERVLYVDGGSLFYEPIIAWAIEVEWRDDGSRVVDVVPVTVSGDASNQQAIKLPSGEFEIVYGDHFKTEADLLKYFREAS